MADQGQRLVSSCGPVALSWNETDRVVGMQTRSHHSDQQLALLAILHSTLITASLTRRNHSNEERVWSTSRHLISRQRIKVRLKM